MVYSVIIKSNELSVIIKIPVSVIINSEPGGINGSPSSKLFTNGESVKG